MSKKWGPKTSELTREIISRTLSYDPVTGLFRRTALSSSASRAVVGSIAGYNNGRGYIAIWCFGRDRLAHRLAWIMSHDDPLPDVIDHIDGNRSNNAISNLRSATHSQNQFNSAKKGVSYNRRDRIFNASIMLNGVRRHLGNFSSFEDARRAYIKAHIEVAGEFSPYLRAGFPSPGVK